MPLRLVQISFLVVALADCGSDVETEAAARAEVRTRSRAAATPASGQEWTDLDDNVQEDLDPADVEPSGALGQTCRDGIGPSVVGSHGASMLWLVTEHTVEA